LGENGPLNISAVGSVTWIAITVCTSMQDRIFQGQKSFQKKAHFDFHDPECRSKKSQKRTPPSKPAQDLRSL
jgi:hypothetical protein